MTNDENGLFWPTVGQLSGRRIDKEFKRIADLTGETLDVTVLKDRVAYLERELAQVTGSPWMDWRDPDHTPKFDYNEKREVNVTDQEGKPDGLNNG